MKCLIIGFGYMGQIRYRVLKDHPAVRAIRVFDPYVKPTDDSLKTLWIEGEKIPWTEFDAVFVCTPNNRSPQFCMEALQYCRHVFCEKPPGRNSQDLLQIAEAAKAAPGHTLVFGFNHRLHPSVQAAKNLIGDGGLGDILYMKGSYGKSGGARYRESWRNQKEISGGGILLDQGIHLLDIFQFFLGPLKVVDALLRDAFWRCGVEDNAFLLLQSQSGIPAFLHSSATLWKHTFSFEIGCREGYLVASGLLSRTGSYGREQLVIGRRQFEDEALALGNPREEIVYFDRDESWRLEVDEFLSAIQEKRAATHGTLAEAQSVMKLIDEIYLRR